MIYGGKGNSAFFKDSANSSRITILAVKEYSKLPMYPKNFNNVSNQ